MSAIRSQLSANEDQTNEVMVRQVNLAAAFHDHISCTKASQQSMSAGICAALQTTSSSSDGSHRTAIGPMAAELVTGVAFESSVESDHMYATDNKMLNNDSGGGGGSLSVIANGLSVRMASGLLGGGVSAERNQISRLTEMILGQLDLIQHQQEQLLKKDRQLQGLKQDREALCMRLEKMEKKIADLMAKVANNNAVNNNLVNNANSISVNVTNSNRNNSQIIANKSNTNNTAETDCDQSCSDTIVESEANSVVGLFTDPTLFTKLYAKPSSATTTTAAAVITSSTTSVNNSVNNSQLSAKLNTTVNNLVNVKIKCEPQLSGESNKSITSAETTATTTTTTTSVTTATASTASTTKTTAASAMSSVRKNRKRHSTPDATQPAVATADTADATPQTITPVTTTTAIAKKRNKASISSDSQTKSDNKKVLTNNKESSCDSLSTTKSNKTLNTTNNSRKRVIKQQKPSESSSSVTGTRPAVAVADTTPATATPISSAVFRTHPVIKDILTTTKPYSIVVNNSSIELCVNNESLDNKLVDNCLVNEESVKTTVPESDDEVIEVPNWRLHPVSSCYSLEGTENLDDEVFNRRHLKLENDERRRKRWDIQRLREQRQNEKLRTGRYYSSSLTNCVNNDKSTDLKKESQEFTSFYPDIKSLQSLEVTDKIPVIAFGHPIPKLALKYFSLPWNQTEKTEKTDVKCEKHEKPAPKPPPPPLPAPSGRASRSTPQKKS
ncbi:unnamed protein product [Medioppia subpectinata]|uniref:PEHE domain-containing protein n=1 Tax=Medioppia subpectinata TaxID=1979941 RepID=A0A7R9L0A9_9ACAR|nr:unnamed protein product [Medioppia subpectinata]CAG2112989.1 unnamed protein product [Medioppia subpectinata]